MKAPTTITIKSDNNILEFVGEKKGIYTYKYISSITKKGLTVELDEKELTKLININS